MSIFLGRAYGCHQILKGVAWGSLEPCTRTGLGLGKDHSGPEVGVGQRAEEGLDMAEMNVGQLTGFSVPGDGGNEAEGEIHFGSLASG